LVIPFKQKSLLDHSNQNHKVTFDFEIETAHAKYDSSSESTSKSASYFGFIQFQFHNNNNKKDQFTKSRTEMSHFLRDHILLVWKLNHIKLKNHLKSTSIHKSSTA